MKILLSCFLLSSLTVAQSPVTLTVRTMGMNSVIPEDFSGLSFETLSLRYNNAGVKGYFFDSSNAELLTLFGNLGIKHLRIGGSSVDSNKYGYVPAQEDIDALFRFAKAANIHVSYSLRLMNGDPVKDASAAEYIWKNYRRYIDCFAIGNEPNIYRRKDLEITGYASYLAKWREFAAALVDSIPDVKLAGPDNDNGGATWGTNFARDEKTAGIISSIYFHYYAGGSSKIKNPQDIIDEVLSPTWPKSNYPARYAISGGVANALGYSYRLTESNSYYTPAPGIWGGNNCFATALFVLDYMYWWAEHGCAGVNFHTTQWKYNGTIHPDAAGGYGIYPMGYGIAAFSLGGHGKADSIAVSNPNNLNTTAYAANNANGLYVTIINKEFGPGARNANVCIVTDAVFDSATVVYLKSPNGVADTIGATLGGVAITNFENWKGVWSPIDSIDSYSRSYMLIVPASSAAIVRLENVATSVLETPQVSHKSILAQN
ncbi:MAG TPA: hypothetical protein VMM58_03135 [Bacteroidota bacterium]|nr:hypothetical protein [Bacteroidota bacterium]